MKFVYPQFLWSFGVLLFPILLHLFHLRKFKVLYFSSTIFLKQLDTTSKSTRKIKQLLVLLCRLLAFSALVLAFAQPYIPQGDTAVDKHTVYCLYIDNSFSMQAMGTEGELFSQAKQAAQQLIQNSPRGTQFIVLSNDFSAEEQQLQSASSASDYIDKLDYSVNSRKISAIFEMQTSILNENQRKGRFILFTDAQKNTWDIAKIKPLKTSIFPIILSAQNPSNLGIDSLWTSSPIRKEGQLMELNIKVIEYSKSINKDALIKVKIDNEIQSQRVSFNGENSGVLHLNYVVPSIGFHTIEVSVQEKGNITFDNQWLAAFNVADHQEIGLINGENAPNNIELVYGLDPFYRITTQGKNQLNFNELASSDLLILNQIKSIEAGLSEQLIRFYQNGGNIALIPSPDAEISSWNLLLTALQLPNIEQVDSSTQYIQTIHTESPFFNGVFEQKATNINLPVFRKTRLTENSRSHYFPLLSYSDNSTFACIGGNKGGKLFLFNSDLDKENPSVLQSDLFSTLFLRIAEFSSSLTPLLLTLGEDSQFPVKGASLGEKPVGLQLEKGIFIPEQEKNQKNTLLHFRGNDNESILKQKIYPIEQDGKQLGLLAFNYKRTESDINCFSAVELTKLLHEKGFSSVEAKKIEETNVIKTIDFDNSFKLWRFLLILAIAFFVIEMGLLKVFKS